MQLLPDAWGGEAAFTETKTSGPGKAGSRPPRPPQDKTGAAVAARMQHSDDETARSHDARMHMRAYIICEWTCECQCKLKRSCN